MSYIYLMDLGYDNLYKIGQSKNTKKRLQSLKAGNPRIKIIKQWQVTKPKQIEKECHNYMSQYHIEREIFKLDSHAIDRLSAFLNEYEAKLLNKRKMHTQGKNKKNKIVKEGQQCKQCGTPVIWQTHPINWKPKKGNRYYYTRWLACPHCDSLYFLKSDRKKVKDFYNPQA